MSKENFLSETSMKDSPQNKLKLNIRDGSVNNSKLADNSVSTEKIQDGNITTPKIANASVNEDKIAEDAVNTKHIVDSAVTTEKIKDSSVTTSKIEDENVTTEKLNDQSVTTEKIANENVTTDKLAKDSVSTDKIINGSVTNDKVAKDALTIDKLDPKLRETINAATGLPDDLTQMIQDVDISIKDLKSKDEDLQNQVDDKQQQITSNDTDIALLQTRSDQMEKSIKDIAVSGGASQASAVTYDNTKSQLDSVNAQGAIDELQTKKFDVSKVSQETGDSKEMVMSQKAVSDKLSDLDKKVDKIDAKSIQDVKQSVQFYADNNEDIIHEIGEDYANFHNLKNNGVDVLTEHQDVSFLATKADVEAKQDKINNVVSTKKEGDVSDIELLDNNDNIVSTISVGTIEESESELVFQNEQKDEDCIKMGSYGIKAKGFYNLKGKPISTNIYVVDKNGDGDFTSLTDCVIEATKAMNSVVYVRDGIYNLYDEMIAHYGKDFFTAQINSDSVGEGDIGRGLLLKNNIHLIFSSKSKVIFNTEISSNPLVREYFSPFNAGEYGFTLENADIECNYCRYCFHDERGYSKESYINKYINCKMKTGNSGDMFSLKPIGGGLGQSGFISMVNCHFNHGITYHNCAKDDAKSTIVVDGCIFDEGTFGLHHYGKSSEITYAYVSNCVIVDDLDSSYETSDHDTPKNTEIIAWNNTKTKEIISNE